MEGSVDQLVREVMRIRDGWRDYIPSPREAGYSPSQELSAKATRIREVRALLREQPQRDVALALLRNLRVRYVAVVTDLRGNLHDRSPYKPSRGLVRGALSLIGLVDWADRVLTEDEALEHLLSETELEISLYTLLADSDGSRWSSFSRDSLYHEEYRIESHAISRIGRDLYAYTFGYHDD